MTKKPKAPMLPPEEDEEQSRRFIEEAEKLANGGELDLTEGERAFERLSGRVLPARKRPSK
jgi:hypothetical protein